VIKRIQEWVDAGWVENADQKCFNWNISLLATLKKSRRIVDPNDIQLCFSRLKKF
jgi:hypothetical protein